MLAGEEVEEEAKKWSRDPASEAYAAELLDLHAALLELEKQLAVDSKASSASDKVAHLGDGVIVQRNTHSIDADSKLDPKTITRHEQRHMARLVIEAVQDSSSKRSVFVVGHPGIGKTRGGLAYTLQELLSRGEAVMRVGYKTNKAHLFLPRKNGDGYTVWLGKAEAWSSSRLVDESNLFVLIDPPERGIYTDTAGCFVIKYTSNNDKHYHNLNKDGKLLVTAMPSESELLAMTKELWSDKSPFSWQQLELWPEREQEVLKRARLMGCAPRYIFSATAFGEELDSIVNEADKLAVKHDGQPQVLLKYLLGQFTNLQGHESSVSSKLFTVEPVNPRFLTAWSERSRANVCLKDIAVILLNEQLKKAIGRFTGDDAPLFERLLQCAVENGSDCSTTMNRDQFCPRPFSQEETYSEMVKLMDQGEECAYLRTSTGFPVVDFVLSPSTMSPQPDGKTVVQEWWNARVGPSQHKVSSTAFVRLMQGLKVIDSEGRVADRWQTMKFKLCFIRSTKTKQVKAKLENTHVKVKKEVVLDFQKTDALFQQFVTVENVDSSIWLEAYHTSKQESLSGIKQDLAKYQSKL